MWWTRFTGRESSPKKATDATFSVEYPCAVWWLTDDPRLGAFARQAVANAQNDIFVSAATGWEVAIKRALGKLRAPDELETEIKDEGFVPLPITFRHAEQAGALPLLHRDPFDRVLIAQALAEDLILITNDERIKRYDVQTLAAS